MAEIQIPDIVLDKKRAGLTVQEKIESGAGADLLDAARKKINETPMTRRAAIATGIFAAVTGATGLANLAEHFRHKNTTDQAEIVAQPKLLNDIMYLDRDPVTWELKQMDEGHVAQSLEVTFKDMIINSEKQKVIVRKEHHISDDENLYKEFGESEINGHDIKVVRVGAVGYQGNNDTHDSEQYTFKTIDENGTLQHVYEWLLLVKDTDDPLNPHIYVDGQGNISETPWFVGPNFVDTSMNK